MRADAVQLRKVAVIGVGRMGNPMARRIRDAGFELSVCDRDAAIREEFAALGVHTTAVPADCAECDAVIVLVATRDQVRAVALGEQGLVKGCTAGTPRYLVVMSTVAPNDVRELAQAVAGTPIQVVDAPVSGGVVSAHAGTLTILAGGAVAAIDTLRPLFDAVSRTVFHCGPLGAGQAAKIANNVIAISNMMVSAEAYRIALANGLALTGLTAALDAASGRNFLSKEPRLAPDVYAAASASIEDYNALQTTNRKDIDIALSLGGEDIPLPATSALRKLLDAAGEETLANWRVIAAQR